MPRKRIPAPTKTASEMWNHETRFPARAWVPTEKGAAVYRRRRLRELVLRVQVRLLEKIARISAASIKQAPKGRGAKFHMEKGFTACLAATYYKCRKAIEARREKILFIQAARVVIPRPSELKGAR